MNPNFIEGNLRLSLHLLGCKALSKKVHKVEKYQLSTSYHSKNCWGNGLFVPLSLSRPLMWPLVKGNLVNTLASVSVDWKLIFLYYSPLISF